MQNIQRSTNHYQQQQQQKQRVILKQFSKLEPLKITMDSKSHQKKEKSKLKQQEDISLDFSSLNIRKLDKTRRQRC